MNTNITSKGTLIRNGSTAILPISDAQFIQYHNTNLGVTIPNISGTQTVENVKDGLDALYEQVSNATPMTEITYANLVETIANNVLKPGTWYRITDYVTTTAAEDTQSANHPFDVIVLATSTNTLSEEARAIQHSGDTYFANSNLNAWKIWYCLENDTNRFAWAEESGLSIVGSDNPATMTRDSSSDTVKNNVQYYAWFRPGSGGGADVIRYTTSENPSVGDNIFGNMGEMINVATVASVTQTGGKGVIYRMIDEFNNDIKYDFKNIQFKRTITDGQYDENGTETWCYTLNVWYNNMCQDASIVGNTLPNDEGCVSGVYNNNFGYVTAYDLYIEGVNTFAFALGDNVVLSIDEGEYHGIYSNTIGNVFYSNTIGTDFSTNTIGNGFYSNTIGNGFYSNTIGNGFGSNTIGDNSHSNMIGVNFGSNTIGADFSSNTIGGNFGSNTIGTDFSTNTIGNGFYSNTIGNYFSSNTIGNGFYSNTIGTVSGNIVTPIDYVRYIRVEDGVQFANITTTTTTSANAYLQNITIAQGIAGVSISNRKTISHPTVNDNFQTIYKPVNSQVVSV